jgi:2-oxoglutarate ferredoxin oxidoreductase subunit alpha
MPLLLRLSDYPQNELPEYMSRELPKVGGVFLQAESEIAAINMVYGAAGSGARVMTSSSSPGIALKQEGISYIAGAELPWRNRQHDARRTGPRRHPARSGGLLPVHPGRRKRRLPSHRVCPAGVQETVDIMIESFDVADQYRIPVLVLGDGMIGQMMEPVEFRDPPRRELPSKEWVTTGTAGRRSPNIINSLFLQPQDLEDHNIRLAAKHRLIEENETRWETYRTDDAEIVFVSYGTSSRITRNAVDALRKEGVPAGLIRPITLWPWPQAAFDALGSSVKALMSIEMSMGQWSTT